MCIDFKLEYIIYNIIYSMYSSFSWYLEKSSSTTINTYIVYVLMLCIGILLSNKKYSYYLYLNSKNEYIMIYNNI